MCLKEVGTMNLLLLLLLTGVIVFKDIRAHRVIKFSNDSIFTNKRNAASNQHHSHQPGNCSNGCLANLFANFTSDVTINITTDMALSSVIQLTHLKNIAVIGYNNPTVQCGSSGGLHFVSCHNVTIEGIIWNECGGNDASVNTMEGIVLYMYNSSDIVFHNCTLRNSLGQSIVLSQVSGSVSINNCNFTHAHNNHYKSHGTAIHYSSKLNDDIQLVFTINNCIFDYNEGASIVYLYQTGTSQKYLLLQNSKFSNNHGVSMYILNHKLCINGVVLFEGNYATDGGGLFVGDHASVIFNESSVVIFSKNVVTNQGGAVFVSTQAMTSFEQNSIVVFNSNRADKGGAVFSENNITIKGNSQITFNNNSATIGGAMACYSKCKFLLVENSITTFTNNNATLGGAICLFNSSNIIFDGNTIAEFNNNTSAKEGGAVNAFRYVNIISKGNSSVSFISNYAKEGGGALIIRGCTYATKGNSTVIFHNNNAIYGGALAI